MGCSVHCAWGFRLPFRDLKPGEKKGKSELLCVCFLTFPSGRNRTDASLSSFLKHYYFTDVWRQHMPLKFAFSVFSFVYHFLLLCTICIWALLKRKTDVIYHLMQLDSSLTTKHVLSSIKEFTGSHAWRLLLCPLQLSQQQLLQQLWMPVCKWSTGI